MAQIIITQNAGFCFGVERATNIAFDASKKHDDDLYTLGPIIHNPQVVKKLESEGVAVGENIDNISNGTVIIRSHGVDAGILEKAKNKNLKVLDATCPFVKKAQKKAESLSNEGYAVLIIGDGNHPEVQAMVSYVKGEVFVAGTIDDALKLPHISKLGIVAQTTQSQDNFYGIINVCMNKSHDIRIYNTICDATQVRQDESIELAKNVECVLVIGGFNSANTKRLVSLCSEIQPNTHHIENAYEIDDLWFDGVEKIGITAGASTPASIIEEVRQVVDNKCSRKKL